MAYQFMRYEKRARIAHVTLNRPQVLNSYHNPMLEEMVDIWQDVKRDDDVWVAIVSGAGQKAFCAGHDLKGEERLEEAIFKEPPSLHYGGIELYKPIIAAVHGYCLGGGMSLALGCDIRIAADDAQFGYPQAKYGLMSFGGHQRMPRMTFPGIAMELMLTGDMIDARRAYELGLVNRVVPRADLISTAEQLAERLCQNAPLSVRAHKEAFLRGQRVPLNEGVNLAMQMFRGLMQSEDTQAGLRAFLERQPLPQWKGR
ncbi:MAG: enoyl-CoA hydratase/isomerase family protein [Chloroflexi bacterium]|nr:enoyl-CoA hydratase/isomerase family protein [Chloroflexota bacterium]